jgi:hypothetical protein
MILIKFKEQFVTDYLKQKYDELESQKNITGSKEVKKELVEKQIEVLRLIQKQFLEKAEMQGYDLRSYNVLDIKLQQFKLMKQLAESVNISTDFYDKQIDAIMKTMFG